MVSRSLSLGGLAMLLLGGCVLPVAPFHDEPLAKEQLTQLKAGATQDQVIELLGIPHATRLGGRFWYFGGTRPVVVIGGPEGAGNILDYNWIEIAFDAELRLQSVERFESKRGCASSGNCLLWGAWNPRRTDMTDAAIITSPPDHDAAAKTFSPPPDGCAIYVFYSSQTSIVSRAFLSEDVVAVRLGEAQPAWLNSDTYMRFEVPVGSVDISVGRVPQSNIQWSCEMNDVSYFWVQGLWSSPDSIEQVDAATGKEEIKARRLLLGP